MMLFDLLFQINMYVFLCPWLDESVRRPLDQFVGHYDYIHYDKDVLLYHHRRVRRYNTFEDNKPIGLSFTAFDRLITVSLIIILGYYRIAPNIRGQ